MEIKIDDLCRHLEMVLSLERKVKVEYFNGKKPIGYFNPKIVTTKMALSVMADEIQMAWYAEIFVDGMCIFRSDYIPSNGDWELAEKRANQKLIESIFCYGVMSSKRVLENVIDKNGH